MTILLQERLARCRGQNVSHAIVELLSPMTEVQSVSFVIYRPAPGLDHRLALHADPSAPIRHVAKELNESWGVPFWDAVLSVAMKSDQIPDAYVDLAILHDKSPDERTVEYKRDDLSVANIESMLRLTSPSEAVALSSKVRLDSGKIAHIPMMDFRCQYTEHNTQILRRALLALGQERGLLVESGRSYHFYGADLLSPENWVRFLALSILFSPVVDVRYVAHRLADGACRLRITPGPGKEFTPVVREVFP
jgi:hypothetical protein